MSIDYQLPDEPYLGTLEAVNGCGVDIYGYTADQMQAAWQAGRDAMKTECVKVCEKWHDSLASEPEMLEIAKEIRGLK